MPFRNVGVVATSEASLPSLAPLLHQLGFSIRAVWSPDAETSLRVAGEWDIPFIANLADQVILRRDVEMVLISGPPFHHSQLCLKALGIGKHVVCDAPCALTTADGAKLFQASNYYPQILSIVTFGLRHLGVMKELKAQLKGQQIGRPLTIELRSYSSPLYDEANFDWRWEVASGGGALNRIGSHLIDLLTFLLDSRVDRVQGTVLSYRNTVDSSLFSSSGSSSSSSSDGENRVTRQFRSCSADAYAAFNCTLRQRQQQSVNASVLVNCLLRQNPAFQLLVFGTDGRLTVDDSKLYLYGAGEEGKKARLIYDGSAEMATLTARMGSAGFLQQLPQLYAAGAVRMLEVLAGLAEQAPDGGCWPETSWRQMSAELSDAATFDGVAHVGAVIDAVRQSYVHGISVSVEDELS